MRCLPLFRLWASSDVIWLIAIQLCILIISLFSTLCQSLSWLLSSNIGLNLFLSLVWMFSISLERVISCLMSFPVLKSRIALWMLIPPVYWVTFPLWYWNLLGLLKYSRGKPLTPPWLPCYRRLLKVILSLFFALYMDYLYCISLQNQVFINLLFLLVLVYASFYFRSFILVPSLVILVLVKQLLLCNNVFGGPTLPLMFACLFTAVLCVNGLKIPPNRPLAL